MGYSYQASCRPCGFHFSASNGGGRHFEQLRCRTCGVARTVANEQIGEALLKYQQESDALDLHASDADLERVRDAYERAVEAVAGTCRCGGPFSFRAPIRCPACRSADIALGAVRRQNADARSLLL